MPLLTRAPGGPHKNPYVEPEPALIESDSGIIVVDALVGRGRRPAAQAGVSACTKAAASGLGTLTSALSFREKSRNIWAHEKRCRRRRNVDRDVAVGRRLPAHMSARSSDGWPGRRGYAKGWCSWCDAPTYRVRRSVLGLYGWRCVGSC